MKTTNYNISNLVSFIWGFLSIVIGLALFFIIGPKTHWTENGQYIIALGCILAPFASYFAAIMFYRAINMQLKSNELQKDANEAQLESNKLQYMNVELTSILKLYDVLISELDQFQTSEYFESIKRWTTDIHRAGFVDSVPHDTFSFEIRSILTSFTYLVWSIRGSNIKDFYKEAILMKIYTLYSNKLRKYIDLIVTGYEPKIESNIVLQRNLHEFDLIITKIFDEARERKIKNQKKYIFD